MKAESLKSRTKANRERRFLATGRFPVPENFHQWPSSMRERFLRQMETGTLVEQ